MSSTDGGHATFPQGLTVQQQNQGHADSTGSMQVQLQQVLGTGAPAVTHTTSAGDQTQQILRQIQETLRKSQASAVSSGPLLQPVTARPSSHPTVSVKQEPAGSDSNFNMSNKMFSNTIVPSATVKTETNLLENSIKQEDVKPVLDSCSQSNIHTLLTNTSSITQATTTLSQASTQMSLFVLSNSSQNGVASQSEAVMGNTSTTTSVLKSVEVPNSSTDMIGKSPPSSGSGALQAIHLPPELQQHFQRVQLEMRKTQAATNLTPEQKQAKLLHLQGFQKKILLKGRVLATPKPGPSPLQQGLLSLNQSSQSSAVTSSVSGSINSLPTTLMEQAVPGGQIPSQSSIPQNIPTVLAQQGTGASMGECLVLAIHFIKKQFYANVLVLRCRIK